MIRPAGPGDVDAIAALEATLFGADAWSVDQVAADLDAPFRVVMVAEVDDVVVGYAVMALAGDVVDLMRIAVGRPHHRAGVASALQQAVEQRAVAAGADRIMVEVAASNVDARGFYASKGFVEIARRSRYYALGDDALVLTRELGLPRA